MMKKSNTQKAGLLMAAATSGIVASSQAAVVYHELIDGDLANSIGSPSSLPMYASTVGGTLHATTDREDHFIIGNLTPGATATFDWSYNMTDEQLQAGFIFSDPTLGELHNTGFMSALTGSNSTPALTVPASGQIRVSVLNNSNTEAGGPTTNWSVSTADVVPEPSSSALVALGALLALRRRR